MEEKISVIFLIFVCLHRTTSANGESHRFVMEPPSEVVYSNSSGVVLPCEAQGRISWQMRSGQPVTTIPGIREILSNGSLHFPAFSSQHFRSDVHQGTYRCRVDTVTGIMLSRASYLIPVILDDITPRVVSTTPQVVPGNTAVLRCDISAVRRPLFQPVGWYHNHQLLHLSYNDNGDRIVVAGNGWELHVRSVGMADTLAVFSCLLRDVVSGQRYRSSPHQIILSDSRNNNPPRLILRPPTEVRIFKGHPMDISCIAHGNPTPITTWHRDIPSSSYEYHPKEISRFGRLAIDAVNNEFSGKWICKISSSMGELTAFTVIKVMEPFSISLQPSFQIIDSGKTATLNCTIPSNMEMVDIEWVKDALPLRSSVSPSFSLLRIGPFEKQDVGIYQCLVTARGLTAQASAELKLGDTSPELHYTFIEQALRPGPSVSLRCSATGSPSPSFTWFLDGHEVLPSHRYSLGQYRDRSGDVVSHLNISNSGTEDGGQYSCKASNSLGEAVHTARLNIYGPPYIRFVGPIKAVAGLNITLYCPFSGYPISVVKWDRLGSSLGTDPRHSTDIEGGLNIASVGSGDVGSYTCSVSSPQGELAKRDLQLIVLKPPQLAPFSFPPNVEEGSNIQATCSVMSGDQPIYFSWYKDNLPIPASLDVEQKNLEFFSILIIKKVASTHSGSYSCIASNAAAKANYSAPLVVRVSPQWLHEPQDVSSLVGSPLHIPCSAQGFPAPQITWLRGQGKTPANYQIVTAVNSDINVSENGTLSFQSVSSQDEGFYLCKASNDIGAGLMKAIYARINEPPRFEKDSENITTKRGDTVSLVCEAIGDSPLHLTWTHNLNRLDTNNYRLTISEAKTEKGVRSQLSIRQSERQDSGLYKCQASNSFGRSELAIHLAVQEKPESPKGLEVVEVLSRSVRLQWFPPYSGFSPLQAYFLQYRTTQFPEWTSHETKNITVDPNISNELNDKVFIFDAQHKEQTIIDNLQPATTYMFRVLAINKIDKSAYCEPVMAKTLEEAPLESPHNIQVQATGPGELLVTWQSPPREVWNGELLGYTVRWVGDDGGDEDSHRVGGWASSQYTITGLGKHKRYQVTVTAFNSAAHGPLSNPVTVTTMEGVPEAPPEDITCSPLSSQSLRITWRPPPPSTVGGILQGYKLNYRPLTQLDDADTLTGSSVKRISGVESQLHGLQPHTTYLIQLRAYTSAGEGVASTPIHCLTHEDAPGPPDGIKAVSMSEDTVLVSWLPPTKPNGWIKHYTVYIKENTRSGKHISYTLIANDTSTRRPVVSPGEMSFEVHSLKENTYYEFWVSATTSFGEGKPTEIVIQKPTTRSEAKIASFGGNISVGEGGAGLLPCKVSGSPPPRTRWLAAGSPVTHQHGLTVSHQGDLYIPRVDSSLSGNFTCVSRNSIGEDQITYILKVLLPPGPPRLLLRPPAFTHSLKLQIEPPIHRTASPPIHGYTLTFKHEKEDWQNIELTSDTITYTIHNLKCGSSYSLFLTAFNRIGVGSPSDIITANTKGSIPKIPEESELFITNSTVLEISLLNWEDTSCPLLEIIVEYKKHGASHWTRIQGSLDKDSFYISNLAPATWYKIKIQATNEAGTAVANYNFATTTVHGARIAAPSNYPDDSISMQDDYSESIIISALCAFIILCSIILAFLIINKRRQNVPCEEKSEDDNCRNCQQSYTALPHKGKSLDDSSELYEISPYATFSVGATPGCRERLGGAGGVSAATLDYTLQFRTFGHQDNEASTSTRQCYHPSQEESSLSTANTVQVRKGRKTISKNKQNPSNNHGSYSTNIISPMDGHSSDSEDSGPSRHRCARHRDIVTSIYTEM